MRYDGKGTRTRIKSAMRPDRDRSCGQTCATSCFWSSRSCMSSGIAAQVSRCTSGLLVSMFAALRGAPVARLARMLPEHVAQRRFHRRPILLLARGQPEATLDVRDLQLVKRRICNLWRRGCRNFRLDGRQRHRRGHRSGGRNGRTHRRNRHGRVGRREHDPRRQRACPLLLPCSRSKARSRLPARHMRLAGHSPCRTALVD